VCESGDHSLLGLQLARLNEEAHLAGTGCVDADVEPCPAVPVIEFRLKFVCLFGGREMGLYEQGGGRVSVCVSLVGIAISTAPKGGAYIYGYEYSLHKPLDLTRLLT